MTRRERRGMWAFLFLTAAIMAGPVFEVVLTVTEAHGEEWGRSLWWLGFGLGFAFLLTATHWWELIDFSALGSFAFIGGVVLASRLLPAGSISFGSTAAFPVFIACLWRRHSEHLRGWVGFIGLIFGGSMLLSAGPLAVRLLTADPVRFATAGPVLAAALGVLGVGAAVALLRSPAVRAFHRFHHTGMSEGPEEAPDPGGLTSGGCIFVSYRRDDSRHVVGRMRDRLVQAFGEEKVFLDIHNIPIGTRFAEVLEQRLRQASVALVVIGPNWAQAADATGRRLDEPEDFVRREVREALALRRPLVPVLVDGARMPPREDLPADIAALVDFQAIRVGSDLDFHPDMDRLIDQLRRPGAAGRAGGRASATVLFELCSDLPYDPGPDRPDDFMPAHNVNERLVAAVGARPMRVVGWSGKPYRVRCEADGETFEVVRTAFLSGALDRLTGVRWESVAPVDDGAEAGRCLPHQVPLSLCEKYKDDAEGMSVVCHLSGIEIFLTEWKWPVLRFQKEEEEAERFIGEPTHYLEQVRVYITRKWGFIYVHSNYIKPGCEFPTKIVTTARLSLFTIFTNLVFFHHLSEDEFKRAMVLHRDLVQYFVNQRKVPKGDAAFYCGAANVRFVSVAGQGWSWWPF